MRRLLPVVLLLPLAAAAAPLSRAVVQACIDEVGHGAPSVAKAGPACARLLDSIKAGVDGVPGDARLAQTLGELSADALRDFAATLPPDSAGKPRRADPNAVEAVLAGLPDPNARPLSFWEKLDAWLRRLLYPDQQGRAPELPDWLLRLLESFSRIPPTVVKVTVWLLFAVLAASLAWVVVRELRAAGLTQRRRPRRQPQPASIEPVPMARLFEGIPECERPAALLRWVIGRLVERGLLPADEALTNRELQVLLPPPARGPFGSLSAFAERAFFGDIRLGAAELDQAAQLAQALTRQDAAA